MSKPSLRGYTVRGQYKLPLRGHLVVFVGTKLPALSNNALLSFSTNLGRYGALYSNLSRCFVCKSFLCSALYSGAEIAQNCTPELYPYALNCIRMP